MDALLPLLEKLQQDSSNSHFGNCVDQLICLIDEQYKDDEDDVQKAIVESPVFRTVIPFLNTEQEQPDTTAKAAQFIAELAKTEAVRVPLVNLGVVTPLLKLIQADCSPAIATQVCRALGNICFDNDEGRKAVDEGEGIATSLNLIRNYTSRTEDGADRVRVLACGFILNLTNECDWLEDKAVEAGALKVLDSCMRHHVDDEDLYNMAVAAFLRVAGCEAAKRGECLETLVSTLVWVVSRENTGSPLLPVMEELNVIAESDDMKVRLADSSLPNHLIRIIHFNNTLTVEDGQNAEECVKLASDLLLSLLMGDGSMEQLYGGGEGQVYRQCVQWLESQTDSQRVLGALAIGNFARSDAHCRQLVAGGMVESLLCALKASAVNGEEANVTLQHAVLSSLRNLAIPASNKARLLDLGVMNAVLELKNTEVMAVTFKLLGVLRMLIDGQEGAAETLGHDKDFLNCLVDWCAVEEHAGVKGEATRLMAWVIKNGKTLQTLRNLVRAEGVPHLVAMATSEHSVMQNEALVALNLLASGVLGDAAVSFKEAGLPAVILKLLKDEETKAELLCNTLVLVRTLATADVLREELVSCGLVEVLRPLSGQHADQRVKDTAVTTLAAWEEYVNR